MVPNARFEDLLSDIEPSATTKRSASSAHTSLRAHLRSHEDFKGRLERDFLAGSYSRDTAIRPRTTEDGQERPDVDIIVVTSFTQSDKPEKVLKEVAAALGDKYTVERINRRSVRVTSWSAEMDVVPVIESGDSYLIPCRDDDGWKPTNPPAHNTWSTEQNKLFAGRAKKLVKMMKWWRRENPTTSRRPKGFVLEVLVAKHAPRDELHLGEAFAQALENIAGAYGRYADWGIKDQINDPAIPGNDIIAKVTLPQWKEFLEKVRIHADHARRAQQADDLDEATRLWRKIFGYRFKSTQVPARATNASVFAATTAPAGGYTFASVDATPTKPRGFA